MNDGQEMMESGQPLPPPQLPDAFAPGAVPPPLPPEYGVIPPTMPLPGAASASNPTPVSHRRPKRRLVFSVGIALAMAGLIAGGIAVAAAQSGAPSTTNTPSATTSTTHPAATRTKRVAVVYTVTAVNGAAIAATESDNGAAVTINTSAQTAIVRAGQPARLSDITVGTKLHVKGHKKAGAITAKRVEIVLPMVEGKVTGVMGDTITVNTRGGSATVTVSGSTVILDAQTRQTITLGGVQPGEKIHAEGNLTSDGSLDALYILVGSKSGTGGPPAPAGPTPTGTVHE